VAKKFTSIKVDDELWVRVKICAAKMRITVSEFVRRALEHELERCEKV